MKLSELLSEIKASSVQSIADKHSVSRDLVVKRLSDNGFKYDNTKKEYTYIGEGSPNLETEVSFKRRSTSSQASKLGAQKPTEQPTSDNKPKPSRNTLEQSKEPQNAHMSSQIIKVTYNIPEDLHKKLKIQALMTDKQVSHLVTELLTKGLSEG